MSRQPSVPGTPSPAEPPAPHSDKPASGGTVALKVEIIGPSRADIEEVARRICISKGMDPDARAYQDREWPLPPVPLGPQWRVYADAAENALVAAMFLQAKARS